MATYIHPENIRERLAIVLEQIEKAADTAGRDPASIHLVVVTKGHPVDVVLRAMDAGICLFGENYVEEAIPKMGALAKNPAIEWHMIGHVQSRKARLVSQHFDCLHSLDSLKLAERLDRFAGEQDRQLPVMLECNVSGEETKKGFPAWIEEDWSGLEPEISDILSLPNLIVTGLMTMAPFFDDPEQARPFFKRLRRLQSFICELFPQAQLRQLSMGMSADYQVAVQEGATHLRIGTAILGPRL